MLSTPSLRSFPNVAFETVPMFVSVIDDGPLSSFQERSSSASSFHASLLRVISGLMSLALCPKVVSQASQHFRSSEEQATCEGCFARQSICSVIFPFTPACPGQFTYRSFRRWTSTSDTVQSGPPISLFTFCSKLMESVRMMV